MKKLVNIVFVVVLITILSITTVMATTSFTVKPTASKSEVGRGEEVTITMTVDNFTSGEKGINAIKGIIEYDKNIFETAVNADVKAQGNWGTVLYNKDTGEFITEGAEFITQKNDILTITLKVKTAATLGNTTVTIKDVEASDAEVDIYPSDQTVTVKITEKTTGGNSTVITPTNNSTVIKNTNASTDIPKTGLEDYIVPTIIVVAALALVSYIGYKRIDK